MVSAAFPNRPFNLREHVWVKQQDVANNRSLIGWQLWVDKTGYSPTWSANGPSNRVMTIDGNVVVNQNPGPFDFRNGDNFLLNESQIWITHNSDGTKTIGIAANANFDILGYTSLSSSLRLPTIPRVSTPSLSTSSFDAGSTVTIYTNRQSSSFTHTVQYAFGTTGLVTIATGVTDSVTWTPPLSLLSQIPNSTSGTGGIRVTTYSGSTNIGYKNIGFTLRAPASIIPTDFTLALDEGNSNVTTQVGNAWVQGQSKVKYTITGAAGQYGATISSYKVVVNGQTMSGTTNTTPSPISASGTVSVTATVTDSRGRVRTKTQNISVLAWSPPKINSFSAARATSSNALNDNGTYFRITLNSSVSGLSVSSVQKNFLRYTVHVKTRAATTWTQVVNTTHSALSYNSNFLIGSGAYSVTTAYDVRVTITDTFTNSVSQTIVSVAKVTMDWGDGVVGIGKYWEKGTLDVGGIINPTGGFYTQEITDWNDAAATGWYQGNAAANAPTSTGWYIGETVAYANNTSWATQVVYPFTSDSASNTQMWRREKNSGTWGAWYRLRVSEAELDARYAPGEDTGWMSVGSLLNSFTAVSSNPPLMRKIGNRMFFKGQLYRSTAPGAGTTAFILPAQYRPVETFWYSTVPFDTGNQTTFADVNWNGNFNIVCATPRTSGVGFSIHGGGYLLD